MDKPSLCSHQIEFNNTRLRRALAELNLSGHQAQAANWLINRNTIEAASLREQLQANEVELRLLLIRRRPRCSDLRVRSEKLCTSIAALSWSRLEFRAGLYNLLSETQRRALLRAQPVCNSHAPRPELPYLLEHSCQRLSTLTLRDRQRRGMEAVLRGSEAELRQLRRARDHARRRVMTLVRGKLPDLNDVRPLFKEWETLAGDCHWAWLEMTVLISYFLSAEQGACFRLLTTAQAQDRLGP